MAGDLGHYPDLTLFRTADPGLLGRLAERHRSSAHAQRGPLATPFDADATSADGFLADLKRIAELGNAQGLSLLVDQAARRGIDILASSNGHRRPNAMHVALRACVEAPVVFEAASDLLALAGRSSHAEYAGADVGVEADTQDAARAAFAAAIRSMLETDHCGSHCQINWHTAGSKLRLVIHHCSNLRTIPTVANGLERVVTFRAAEQAVVSYSAATGRLELLEIPRYRRSDVAEAFATTMLGRPGFFAGDEAQRLYTLAPVERAGSAFRFIHAFDPGIRRVSIIEAQAVQSVASAGTKRPSRVAKTIARDACGNALEDLAELTRDTRFGTDCRLEHIVFRVYFDTDIAGSAQVTVKLKPPSMAVFRRHRFEDRILTLLHRNGLMHDRHAYATAIAAE